MASVNNDFRVKHGLVVSTTATVLGNTVSTSTDTGALLVSGGVGIGGNINIGAGLVASGINLLNKNENTWYVDPIIGVDDYTKNDHLSAPARTIKYILSHADAGDTVFLQPGTYHEAFPITIPKGVNIRGAGLREVLVYPTTATNTSTAFLLNGESHISDFTVGGFYKPGYAFEFAPNAVISSKSPYIERFSVITKGSVVSDSDPYGFDANDAGNGAKIDGSRVLATSTQASMMFNEATFIVPNATGLYMTNGARSELVNGFFYFADKAINAVSGTTGYAGAGLTKLKLGTVTTGTFTAGDTIIYKSSTGTTLASGTIASVVGSYVYINGPAWGFETAASKTPKITTAYGTTALSTAQKKFGTASLHVNGSAGGYAITPTSTDFQFGTTDFTIECWIYRSVSGAQHQIIDFRTAATQNAPRLYIPSSNTLGYYVNGAARITGGTVSSSTWHHVAVSRSGTSTKLFLDGIQTGSTWTDTTDYIQNPLTIGAQFDGTGIFNGYIDDLRISNVAKYTTTYTPSTTELVSDESTMLMLHFNGADASTVLTDDSYIVTQDITSTGTSPAAATNIVLADYHQFGAEVRSLGSSAVFGNSGVTANGTGTDIKLVAFNLSHIGSGKDSSDDISLVVQANEVIQLNNGKVYYQTIDQNGDFRVGDSFLVNQRTGNVSFGTAEINLSNIGQLTVTDGVNSTLVSPTSIGVGSLILGGSSVITQSGNLTLDPAGTLTTINSDAQINGFATIASSALSVSTTTGALVVAGGVGIGGNLYVGGEIVAQKLTIQYTTVTTTIVETDDIITTFNTTTSVSTTTGALVVAGGVGIGGNVNIGGTVVGGGIRTTTTSTAPQNATSGDIWYHPTLDILFRYTFDGTNTNWIDMSGPIYNFR
jgi:hypothetical protein